MIIGVPKERRSFEYRVGLTPASVQLLCQSGHPVYVEHDAGIGAGFNDVDYQHVGATIAYSPQEVFGRADFIIKVARPLLEEIEWTRPGVTLAGLLHLTSSRQDKVKMLLEKEITAIAFEQIQLSDGSFPVLRAMSQIGGRLAAQIGARLLQNNSSGKGILLGGIAGVPPAEVGVIGAGVVGTYATQAFLGMGAHVTVLDNNLVALQKIFDSYPGIVTMVSNPLNIARVSQYADILVGAVLIPGERAPVVVTRENVKSMKSRSVIMDISIDEGGCIETSRPTTHDKSYYLEEGVIHYCVPNIPSVVARTATHAFNNAAFPYIMDIANIGIDRSIEEHPPIEHAVNTRFGKLVHLKQFHFLPDTE